jgi:AcrR family transcriptional regulator
LTELVPRARPEQQIRRLGRQHHGRGPRERLLAESFVLFYDRGIRNVGIDLLIARAEVAKASMYHHFPSKSDLIIAYLDERETAWLQWLRTTVDERAGSPEGRLEALFEVLAEQIADPGFRGSAVANALAEVGQEHPEVVARAREHGARLRDYLESVAADAGASDAAEAAATLRVLIEGVLSAGRLDPRAAATAGRAAAALIPRS